MDKKGFTILELLIVIAVIGLLASILLVSFEGAKERARIAQGWQFSDSLRAALQMEMVAWWPLDRIVDTDITPDNWFDQNHGTVYGATLEEGIVNNALKFNGEDDYVDCGNDESLDIGTHNWSLELWMKQSVLDQINRFIIIKQVDASNRWYLWTGAGNTTAFRVTKNGSQRFTLLGTSKINDTLWHHIAVSLNRTGNAILFVDGNQEDSEDISSMSAEDWTFLTFLDIAAQSFNGLIDEVRIYKAALPQSAIQQHYTQGLKKHQNLTRR